MLIYDVFGRHIGVQRQGDQARRRVLTEAARRRAAVIPAHYPGPGGATVVARGDEFIVDDWLGLPAI